MQRFQQNVSRVSQSAAGFASKSFTTKLTYSEHAKQFMDFEQLKDTPNPMQPRMIEQQEPERLQEPTQRTALESIMDSASAVMNPGAERMKSERELAAAKQGVKHPSEYTSGGELDFVVNPMHTTAYASEKALSSPVVAESEIAKHLKAFINFVEHTDAFIHAPADKSAALVMAAGAFKVGVGTLIPGIATPITIFEKAADIQILERPSFEKEIGAFGIKSLIPDRKGGTKMVVEGMINAAIGSGAGQMTTAARTMMQSSNERKSEIIHSIKAVRAAYERVSVLSNSDISGESTTHDVRTFMEGSTTRLKHFVLRRTNKKQSVTDLQQSAYEHMCYFEHRAAQFGWI